MDASQPPINDSGLGQRFGKLWDVGRPPPDVFAFLGLHPLASAREQGGVLLVDQFHRSQLGEELPLEVYFQRCPQVAADPELALELLTCQYESLQRRGEELCAERYVAWFPGMSAAELHARVREQAAKAATRTALTVTDTQYPLPAATDPASGVPTDSARAGLDSGADSGQVVQSIGRYLILRPLGEGGFGRVYLAMDLELGRQVAVKVPHPKRIDRTGEAEHFLAEARVVARLDHPGIVPVYDAGRTEDGLCYIVSKYIAGENLAAHVRLSPPSVAEAVRLVATVAESLQYAHSQGLVHRDIKPSNILLDAEGAPYLADFGVALQEEEFGSPESRSAGTPAYMSPEQACGEGHRVDGRSDIFSLGVVLYELLTGHRPFRGAETTEILEQIRTVEARPLRQWDESIPRELERICLKALAKRAADRHLTAKDLAEDLRHFLAGVSEAASGASDAADGPTASQGSRIVPKGLRSFGAADADFFLELLPGPRDREGLPDSIRFWKTRIEALDPEETFTVGLIYGPSGCGKSSLVQAGLLPKLADDVLPVFVECTAQNTEARLLSGLRRACAGLFPNLGLSQSLAVLRRGDVLPGGRKLLIVLDQFEQWLHAPPARSGAELIAALRQCDGTHVQCLVLVRDDFWMAVTGFFQDLEVRLVEGRNSAAVDLFDRRHARNVLAGFGRALGCLPADPSPLTPEQSQFLDEVVEGLQADGKVVCVRLTLLVEVVKHKEWTPSTLRALGGVQGVGVSFLEETFGSEVAPPQHRRLQGAARAVLQALLPEAGIDIRGHMQPVQRLRQVCREHCGGEEFDHLLQLLDGELRLITPADPEGCPAVQPEVAERERSGYYQLTHDFLVSSIRQWLTRKQRETRRGRAALRLAELAGYWKAKPEVRHVPDLWEFLRIRLMTESRTWTDSERQLMGVATRRHGKRAGMAALFLFAMLIVGVVIRQRLAEGANEARAEELVTRLKTVQITELPELIEEMAPYRRWADPKLQALLQDSFAPPAQRLRARLALVDRDPEQVPFLIDQLLSSRPEELLVIRDRLLPASPSSAEQLWAVVMDAGAEPSASLRAACALATYAPDDSRWGDAAHRVAGLIVRESQEDLPQWRRDFQPVGQHLVSPLIDVFRNSPPTGIAPVSAAILLADYAESDKSLLADLSLEASPEQFAILLPKLRDGGPEVVRRMTDELAKKASPQWDDEASLPASRPSAEVVRRIEESLGMLTPSLAFCQTLELSAFDEVAKALGECGYQPYCVRPYAAADRVQVAAVWRRMEGKWRFLHGKTAEELRDADEALWKEGFIPFDVARYRPRPARADGEAVFAGLWGQPRGRLDTASVYVAVPDEEHQDRWEPLNKGGFVPRTNLMFHAAAGKAFFSSVRWKLRPTPTSISVYFDADWQMDRAEYERRLESQRRVADGWCQADVRLSHDLDSPEAPKYSAIWWNGTPWESQELHDRSPDSHLVACRALADDHYRPAAISLSRVGDTVMAASVWQRPLVPESRKDELAQRQANAAVALLRLGEGQAVWRRLEYQSDPRLRTYLIHRLYPLGADPRRVAEQLRKEPDEWRRQALLLALALFPAADLEPLRSQLTPWLLDRYRNDPSPGVHSAVECLLRRWKLDGELAEARRSLAGQAPRDGQRWYHTPQGHTLVLIPGPVEFVMGSTGSDDERDHQQEVTHLRRISRSFGIAAHEVTVEQFLRFQAKFPYVERYSPSPACPINNVSWYDAARYCNWLSEKEGIPPEQWCYPLNDEIRDGMTLAADYLSRTGYRLPTEAEWEYAARAGTTTTRYFGHAPELVAQYSWNVDNANVRAWPVGSLLPNGLGLFDMLGNAMEWCQDAAQDYPQRFDRLYDDDPSDELRVSNDRQRRLRGGAILYVPSNARSAQRHRDFVDRQHPYVGFRVARTFTDPASLSRP